MLSLCFSNRFEALRHALLQALATDPEDDPFAEIHLIVPGEAMRRALALAVADAQGVCAQLRLDTLDDWLQAQGARLLPGAPGPADFAPPRLAWRVYRLLGEADAVAAQPRLQAWLDGADALPRWELAQRCAALLQQYLADRPDWLQAWSESRPAGIEADAPDEAWQAALWRGLRADLPLRARHPVEPLLQALQRLDDAALHAAGLPQRLHVFAPLALTPPQRALLQALARRIDVRLYMLNPCREYWFDVVDPRRLARLEQQGRAQHHEVGQRLLAAWGQPTQALLDRLLEATGEVEIDEVFIPRGTPTLLARLQDAVLALQDLAPCSVALAADDRSLEVHVAHTRWRELEVLQDRLLALFAADPTLQPSDILVATPALDAFAPLVAAVFGTAPAERFIPYAVGGRAPSRVNAPARVLLSLLALAGSRFSATGVFELLQQPLVARRFELDAAALERVRAWLREAAVHGALDGGRHSLGEGLSRLFLGYALPAQPLEPFGERLPAGACESEEDTLALGAFWRFVSALRRLDAQLSAPLPPATWRAALLDAIDTLLTPEDADQEDARALQRAVAALAQAQQAAALEEPVPLPVLRAALQAQLDADAPGAAPTGRLTFAPMDALRGLPFRVVCVVGLDDGAFPGTGRPDALDLRALAPRRGDPQRRQEERNVFLDLLLAAQEHLVLSYTGRSARDHTPLPPSVLVSELLEALAPAIAADESPAAHAAARARLVVEHPLQAFDASAFDPQADPRRRSFNAELAAALQQAAHPSQAMPAVPEPPLPEAADEAADLEALPDAGAGSAFFAAPLPPLEPSWRHVTLEQLNEFFRHPGRYLLERRLGLALPRAPAVLAESEPAWPDAADRRALAQRLLPALAQGSEGATLWRLAQAGTEYPAGPLGALLLRRELGALSGYAGALREAAPALPPGHAALDFELQGERWQLEGARADLRPQGLTLGRYGEAGAQAHLEAWLWHLWLCASRPPGVAPRTRWQARDGAFELAEAAQPRRTLAALLALYRQGLSQPLRFFPRTAWAFVEAGESLPRARSAWRGGPQHPGEGSDDAWRLALRGIAEPLDAEFMRCARAVFGPLRRCLREAAP